MNREARIEFLSVFILIGFIVSLVDYVSYGIAGFHQTIYDFMLGSGRFDDFLNVNSPVRDNNPYSQYGPIGSPFPLLYRIAFLFARLPMKLSVILFVLLFVTLFLTYCYRNISLTSKTTNIKNVLLISFFSYPFLFTLARGNYEVVLFAFIALFVYFYQRENTVASIVFLALALATKPFSGIFLVLLISDRKFKEIAYTVSLALIITIISYASFQGGFIHNFQSHLTNLKMYNTEYALGNAGLGYGSSLFGLGKALIMFYLPTSSSAIVAHFYKAYSFFALVMLGFVAIYTMLMEKEFWRKITLMVFCMCLLPHVSADYRLIQVFIPLFLFINKDTIKKSDVVYLVIFSSLLVTKGFYYFRFESVTGAVSFATYAASILNPIIMISGVAIIMIEGFLSWRKSSQPSLINR